MSLELRRLRRSPFAAGLLLMFTVGLVLPGVRAEDKPAEKRRVVRYEEHAVPMLSRIPYINRLFKNVGVAVVDEEGAEGEAQFERVGIDFDMDFDLEVVGPGTSRATILRVSGEGCPNACCQEACEDVAALCPTFNLIKKDPEPKDITALLMANVRLQTQLEMKEAFDSEREEMLNSLVELTNEKAKLEAALEMAQASHEMLMKIVEVKVENEKLKAKLELLEGKAQGSASAAVPQVSGRSNFTRRR